MSNITDISYERARDNAHSIKECSTTMNNIFNDFNSTMNVVGQADVFYGDASESLNSRFNSLKPKFDEFVRLVDDFSFMILRAVEATQQTEAALKGEVDNTGGNI